MLFLWLVSNSPHGLSFVLRFNHFLYFFLSQETSEIEEQNEKVEIEIRTLRKQVENLQHLLKEHACKKHTVPTIKSTIS